MPNVLEMTPLTSEEVNAFLAEAFPASYNAGIRCDEVGDRTAVARLEYDPKQVRPGNYISGPNIFATADSALWFATFTMIGIEPMAVTSEMSIRFLRPAIGGDLVARATINSSSSRRFVGTIDLWVDSQPDRIVAIGQGTYALSGIAF